MKNINVFIKENIKTIGKDIYVTPDIPEKKLNNVIKAFKCEKFYTSILAIYDNTIFGSAKEGLVFTGEKMLHHEYGEFLYSNINSVEYVEKITVDAKGKEEKDDWIIIVTKNKKKKKLVDGLSNIDKKKLVDFLNKIITEFEDYKEEDQLKTISEMPDELKLAYLQIIANMTFSNDEIIDEKELAELFLLMTRLEINSELRFKIRTYITEMSTENIISIEKLLQIIKNNAEASHYKSLMISLAKDLINIYFSTNDLINRDFAFLKKYQSLFELSDDEINLAYEAVESDYKLLKEDLDDTAIEKNAKELAAKAAAAGVPLAAVYISGSVIGMSAAGITSGLAALGMGMGMTGGLAVVGLIGVISYKGIKHLTGANELDRYKTRELMLHDIIKQTQKTISQIINDINYIVLKLNETILNHANQAEKIQKLMKMISQFQGALQNVDNKSNIYQNSANRLQNPKVLDNDRLKSLTSEPTKKPLYDFIIANYEPNIIKVDNKRVEQLLLKENLSTDILAKMSDIFKALGYFEVDSILMSKASNLFKGILG